MAKSILIIDDSKAVRQEITQCLREMALFDDYREAGDGIDGLKSLLEETADLVICDLEMPRMDGFKFILSDGSWLLVRFSGTEPLIRVYAEALSLRGLRAMLADGEKLIR